MSYRKSCLVFVLAFVALSLGCSQEARGQWEWFWGDFPPGSIDGGSSLNYTCTQGEGGTNTLTIGKKSDSFVSASDGATVSCDFFIGNVPKGKDIKCSYSLEWSGDLVDCMPKKGDAVVTVSAQCADVIPFGKPHATPSGTLHCAAQPDNLGGKFPEFTDKLGIDKTCNDTFKNTPLLFFQVTFAGQTCPQVLASANDPTGLKVGAITDARMQYCHSDGKKDVSCANRASSEIHNVADVGECIASPKSWNVKCDDKKDNGVGRVCLVNGGEGVFSFDVTRLDPATAALNGVPVNLKKGQPECKIIDCNKDGQLDLQCEFPTCFDGDATAAPPLAAALGELTMSVNFLDTMGNTGGGLACTTTVKTTGKGRHHDDDDDDD